MRQARQGSVVSSSEGGSLVLPYGHFYGDVQTRRHVAGFELAVMNADPTRHVERHSHEDAHFVLLTDGLYLSSASGAPSICSGATLIYNPPGTTHRDRFEAQGGAVVGRFFTLSIATEHLRVLAEEASLEGRATCFKDPRGIGAARCIAGECARWSRESPLVVEALALELLGRVARGEEREEPQAPRWLRMARELILETGSDSPPLSVGAIARAAGVHPVHLARTFRRFHGCTPGEFLRRRRLERGAVMLSETSRPLSDVALCCGFTDQSHFTRAFKQYAKVTPAAYRRQARPSPTRP